MAAQNQLNFSRDMEREADRVGFGVMTQAGFEPQGFVTMFEKLQQASRLNDNGSFPYLRSHPLTTERIADMQVAPAARRRTARGPQEPTMVHAMMAARARVLSYPGVDPLRAWLAEPESSGFAIPERAASCSGAVCGGAGGDRLRGPWPLPWRWPDSWRALTPGNARRPAPGTFAGRRDRACRQATFRRQPGCWPPTVRAAGGRPDC